MAERSTPLKAAGFGLIGSPRIRNCLFGAFLIIATFVAYYPAWNGTPLWDDDAHMTRPELRSVHGLMRIWTEPGAAQQYYPLVHTCFWIGHRLWGDAPIGYHLLNILLHASSALLLFGIFKQLKVPGAPLAALLFALHPIQVESVAWISELKNALAGLFLFGSAMAYLRFDRHRKGLIYALSLGLFICGLLSKTAIAPMPVALLAVLWWKQGKELQWRRHLLLLAPLLAAGVAFGLFTSWMERHFIIAGSIAEFGFSLTERCFIAGRAFWFYLEKIFLPVNLMFFYPRWNIGSGAWYWYCFPAAAVLLFFACWLGRKRSRAPLAALIYYVVMLGPALGFVNIYPFQFSFAADHFQYFAGIGPMALAAAGLGLLPRNVYSRWLLPVVIATTLAILTFQQSRMYGDSETLYRATLDRNPSCWLAHNNLALILMNQNKVDEAFGHFQRAVEIKPNYADAHCNLGSLLLSCGRINEAVVHYRTALKFRPGDAENLYNLGTALLQNGSNDEGIADLREALKIKPDYPEALNNMGLALMRAGRNQEAIVYCRKAMVLKPDNDQVMDNLAKAYYQCGRASDAIACLRRALAINPAGITILKDLSIAYLQTGRLDSAIATSKTAMAIARTSGQDDLATMIGQDIGRMQSMLDSSRSIHPGGKR